MQCSKCNCSLSIGKTHIEFEGDKSPDTETKAFNVMPMLCTNSNCTDYAGKDLDNPIKILQTLRQLINPKEG